MNPYDLESGGHSASRRGLFQGGAAAAAGSFAAQAARAQGTAPTAGQTLAATKFRAFVRHGTEASIEELTLRPIQPEQVVLRTQAAQSCYTIVSVLGNAAVENAAIVGHGGVGIVEAVGAHVKRVRPGDCVIVPVTPQCGQCWMCLHGRADVCRSAAERPNLPVAHMRDGTPVFGTLGGFAELMIAWEDQTVPIFTDVPAAELSLLSCVTACGLGLALRRAPMNTTGGMPRKRDSGKTVVS